jgi:urease accessory protein
VSSLVVSVGADGRSVVRRLRGSAPLGLREVHASNDGQAARRVAIVQTAAYLVGGDEVRLHVRVDDGAALELCEISATLVHPGGPARQIIDVEVGDHARLVFAELPVIVASGARLERRLTITLGVGSQVVHRDTLVLGRHGEALGDALVRSRVERAGVPVLDETLDSGEFASPRSAAVLGDTRVIGTLARYGTAGSVPEGAFALSETDTLVRRLARRTRDLRDLDACQSAWSTTVLMDPDAL